MTQHNFPIIKLNGIIDFVWENSYSAFYRDMWQSKGMYEKPFLDTVDDWKLVPLLERNDLSLVTNPTLRCFMPISETDALYTTSGTSGAGPLIFWRTFPKISEQEKLFKHYKILRKQMIGNHNRSLHALISYRNVGVSLTIGDPHNFHNSARLAKKIGVDALLCTTSIALAYAPYLKDEGCIEKISMLQLTGEYCSDTTYDIIKSLYTNAVIVLGYGQAESGGSSAISTSSCEHANRIMHVFEHSHYFEIVDDELVLTTLTLPFPTPLIRYRTGDMARFVDAACPCGKTTRRIEILGRINGDFIRTVGGEIRTEELDRVLESQLPYIEPTYSLEIGEQINETKKINSLKLLVTKRANISIPNDSLKLQLHRELTENMRLSQNMKLKDAIKAEFIRELEIDFIAKPEVTLKHKKLIRKF